jgi:hypothetical protein
VKYRGHECEKRPFSDATGDGTEWLQDGAVVVREHATRISTPEEITAAANAEVERAGAAARLVKLHTIRAAIKAGTDTAADRAKAIRLLIGVVENLAPEADES